MTIEGAAFVIIGGLEAFPRRLAARAIKARGGDLRRGLSRQTKFAVFGHLLTQGAPSAGKIEGRIEEARKRGASLLSENTFLRLLGLAKPSETTRDLSVRQLLDQSGLDRDSFERLGLFDVFETAEPPFGFRDLVAARQYARLQAEGVDWLGIVRAVRSRRLAAPDGGVASVRLERSGDAVLMQEGATLSELSGQLHPRSAARRRRPRRPAFRGGARGGGRRRLGARGGALPEMRRDRAEGPGRRLQSQPRASAEGRLARGAALSEQGAPARPDLC